MAALFEEAGVCMLNLPGLAGPPLLAFIGLFIFLVFWAYVIICIATANYPGMTPSVAASSTKDISVGGSHPTALSERNNTYPAFKCNFLCFKIFKIIFYKKENFSTAILRVEYIPSNWIRSMLWIYLIGLIWTSEFIFACQQFTLAAAVAFWYFRKPTDSPVIYAMGRLFKYHLGSVAKGSFIITLFKIPRLILTFLYAK